MGSIANSLPGLSFLREPGGILSNLPAKVATDDLKSASPQDIVSLSMAAIQKQQVDGLFGAAPSAQAASPVPGIADADLEKAAPQEKSTIYQQSIRMQQVQGLFAEPQAARSTTSVLG